MAQEIAIQGYYQNTRDQGFTDSNQAIKLGMEFFLSELLFKGDLSRVLYSKDDVAFRRRIETLGKGSVGNDEFNYISLKLPYAIYSQSSVYEEDDRESVMSASQIVLGMHLYDRKLKLKSAAMKVGYTATAFFSRRDDVNIASQLLYWEKQPIFPVYFIVINEIAGYPVPTPVFITLESFDSTVEYAEKDWLTNSKIFPVKMEFSIRTYQSLIENIDQVIKLPIRFTGMYGYNNDPDDPDNNPIQAEKTTLMFADKKWTPEAYEKQAAENSMVLVTDKNAKVLYATSMKKQTIAPLGSTEQEVDETIGLAVKGYFSESRDCTLQKYFQNDDLTTETEVCIDWKVTPAELPDFDSIILYVPGLLRQQTIDPHLTQYTIKDLNPGSEYDCSLIVNSKTGNALTYKLKLHTKGDPVLKKVGNTLQQKLIGTTFTNTRYVTDD